jgi:hypothetical protein
MARTTEAYGWEKRAASDGVFARRQRVAVRTLHPQTFEPSWDERATIVDGRPQSVSLTSGDWYEVRYDDGGRLCVHADQLRALEGRERP